MKVGRIYLKFQQTSSFQNHLFKQPKNGETPQRFWRGSKKDGSVYRAKWHILASSIEMSKTRLWKPNNYFIFKTKGIIWSATVRSFQQQLKTTIIWLSSMGYHSAIQSAENITKAVTRSPNYLCNKFYKEFKSSNICENKADLLKFFDWLD